MQVLHSLAAAELLAVVMCRCSKLPGAKAHAVRSIFKFATFIFAYNPKAKASRAKCRAARVAGAVFDEHREDMTEMSLSEVPPLSVQAPVA